MSEASAETDIALTLTADDRDLFARARRDPYFLACVFFALAAHLLLFIGFRPHARVIGDPGGLNNPIAVSIISSNELKRLSPQSAEASSPPPQPPPAPPTKEAAPEPAAPPPPQTPPPAEAQAPPQPAEPPAPEPPPAAAPAEAQKPAATTPVLDPLVPDGLAAPSPKKEEAKTEDKPEQPEPKPATKAEETPPEPPKTQTPQKVRKAEPATTPPKQKSAALDLRMPPPSASTFTGKRAGVERPPGITRSGENDAFAQGVIRALQATMPQMSTVGRVTVRITLDMNGNVVRTEVVRPSDDPILNQSVVFATKQSNFPLPPLNAKPQDLVFVVTYNYTVR